MGLFDWMGGSVSRLAGRPGPTPEGIYGALPKGSWELGPDPAGDPKLFVPQQGDLPFDLVDWQWDKSINGVVSTRLGEKSLGFSFLFVLSDGNARDSAEFLELGQKGFKPAVKHEWMIPVGHPTREGALISLGDQTNNLILRLQECFGWPRSDIEAIPEKTAVMVSIVILRGFIAPQLGRFTARMKVFLSGDKDKGTYGEFFLSINSQTRKAWVSEKATEYRPAIINWFARPRRVEQRHS